MASKFSTEQAKQIHLMGSIMRHRNGAPMVTEIGKALGEDKRTISMVLKQGPRSEDETPTPEEIIQAKNTIWQEIQGRSFTTMLDGWQGVVDRWNERANDPEHDARDLRHTAHALDIGTKVLQLLTGGVTSRSQQEQTIRKDVNIKLIQVPEKETAAFRTTKGLKQISASSVEIVEDE